MHEKISLDHFIQEISTFCKEWDVPCEQVVILKYTILFFPILGLHAAKSSFDIMVGKPAPDICRFEEVKFRFTSMEDFKIWVLLNAREEED